MRLQLAATPLSVIEANRKTLADGEARRYRMRLIEQADHSCQRCHFVAWSAQRMKEMVLRPKEAVAGNPSTGDWVLCRRCALAHDAKKRKRAS